eukprot:GABV01013044.1.p2 GENE.GABV01013044.1~~GABV01013044.1.p2  ORF type:complete len:115 (-),score=28.30 GABV01013044.1:53-361(-)
MLVKIIPSFPRVLRGPERVELVGIPSDDELVALFEAIKRCWCDQMACEPEVAVDGVLEPQIVSGWVRICRQYNRRLEWIKDLEEEDDEESVSWIKFCEIKSV